jgi:hypothetical protein
VLGLRSKEELQAQKKASRNSADLGFTRSWNIDICDKLSKEGGEKSEERIASMLRHSPLATGINSHSPPFLKGSDRIM